MFYSGRSRYKTNNNADRDLQRLFDVDCDTQKLARRIAGRYFIDKDQRKYEFLNLFHNTKLRLTFGLRRLR